MHFVEMKDPRPSTANFVHMRTIYRIAALCQADGWQCVST
jgi:hypothetical protein